jgi:hypothetical protein
MSDNQYEQMTDAELRELVAAFVQDIPVDNPLDLPVTTVINFVRRAQRFACDAGYEYMPGWCDDDSVTVEAKQK